jgi:membrane fusion protein, multidrug efflux system
VTYPIRLAGIVLAVACAGFIVWRFGPLTGAAPTPKEPAREKIPVITVAAERRDAPVFLSAIATVQAFNTVLVRARVDGEIRRVAFSEGTNVKRGDVLVELDPRPLQAQLQLAEAQKEKDQTQLSNAKRDLARYEYLVKLDSAPSQTLDTTQSLVDQLGAAINADEAQVEFARLQVTYATIRAPISGRAGARLVDAGNMVHPGDANGLVVLTQVNPIAMTFALPQDSLSGLRAQQAQHPLRVMAITEDGSRVLDEGTLTLIDNQIDAATGTIRCKAVFANAKEALWPGQFVTARVLLKTLSNAVVVPATAVQAGAQGPYVYVISEKKLAELRRVETGQSIDGQTVITRGLSGGEQVVVEGQFQLEPNAPVAVKAATPAGNLEQQ